MCDEISKFEKVAVGESFLFKIRGEIWLELLKIEPITVPKGTVYTRRHVPQGETKKSYRFNAIELGFFHRCVSDDTEVTIITEEMWERERLYGH